MLIVAIISTACAEKGEEAIDILQSGSSMEVQLGEEFYIYLEGNPSTGYTWEVIEDGALVTKLLEEEWMYEEEIPGSPGTVKFTFTAEEVGEAELKLVYHRTWEDEPPAEEYTLTIIVKE